MPFISTHLSIEPNVSRNCCTAVPCSQRSHASASASASAKYTILAPGSPQTLHPRVPHWLHLVARANTSPDILTDKLTLSLIRDIEQAEQQILAAV